MQEWPRNTERIVAYLRKYSAVCVGGYLSTFWTTREGPGNCWSHQAHMWGLPLSGNVLSACVFDCHYPVYTFAVGVE